MEFTTPQKPLFYEGELRRAKEGGGTPLRERVTRGRVLKGVIAWVIQSCLMMIW